MAVALPTAEGATPCVNPAGASGCSSSISAAVAAAAAGSTIQVAAGVYKESVVITKPLSLIGDGGRAIIDATGKNTGIFINGLSAAPGTGIFGGVLSGFTIRNANFEGLVVANVSGVTITNNTLYGNNVGLQVGNPTTCPGLPDFETNEGFDCGEAIHLTGVDHSVIANNLIENNAGGILLSDETGPTYENLVTGNTVADNAYDCGITIASHVRAPNVPPGLSFGVFHNTVSRNLAQHNGSLGAGSGVGIYAGGPGNTAWANVVIDNVLIDNGIGGVSMHNHAAAGFNGVPAGAPPFNLNDNVITGNYIAGNEADDDDPTSPGPTGISLVSMGPILGTVISQNQFDGETADIAFQAPGGSLQVHLNNFSSIGMGVDNEGGGSVDATQNWWGCPDGPGGAGCATVQGSNITVLSSLPSSFVALRPGRTF
jgi:parallel beta-helix repeat protein